MHQTCMQDACKDACKDEKREKSKWKYMYVKVEKDKESSIRKVGAQLTANEMVGHLQLQRLFEQTYKMQLSCIKHVESGMTFSS